MPEGPEVAITADQLSIVKGCTATGWRTGVHGTGKIDTSLWPTGSTITNVRAFGKKLIFDLSYSAPDGISYPWCMICSLGMTGRWSWDRLGEEYTILEMDVTNNDGKVATIRYTDPRKLGSVKAVFTAEQYTTALKTVGPPHLSYPVVPGSAISAGQWHAAIRDPRRVNIKIATFLKKPEWFSGVGNYLRSEILYECRIDPHRPLCQLNDLEIEALRVTTADIMYKSYLCHGKTLSDFITPDGRSGTYITKVYPNNIRRPQVYCPLGYPITHQPFDGQTVHWVPAVQK